MPSSDLEFMRAALDQARQAGRETRPNPRVGAVLVSKKGEIVSNHTAQVGGPHAERRVLDECAARGIDTLGATLFVTLEPCSHHGRTPPCTDAILQAQISRVVVAREDPNPKVKGKGLEALRNAGIQVEVGVLSAEATQVNREWLRAHEQGYPFVILKMATSIDGLWTSESGESKWITGPEARKKAHQLRSDCDALITSSQTVLADDPLFTARSDKGELLEHQPRVFVLSQKKAFDLSQFRLSAHPRGAESHQIQELKPFLKKLHEHQSLHFVMLEAGPTLTQAFLSEGLFNEVWHFVGPSLLGGQGARLKAFNGGHLPGLDLKLLDSQVLGDGNLFLRWVP